VSDPGVTRRRPGLTAAGLVIGATLLAAAGCGRSGPTLAAVEGTLRWRGKPVSLVQVIFVPDEDKGARGPRSTAVTDSNGRFQLSCDNGQPGAVVGPHRVVVFVSSHRTDTRAPKGAERSAAPAPAPEAPSLPPEYMAAATTPLVREVRPGAQTIDLDLP
jgi:hypothetical protein